jgi:hypothetical protein
MSTHIVWLAAFENIKETSYTHKFDLGAGRNLGTRDANITQSAGTEVT